TRRIADDLTSSLFPGVAIARGGDPSGRARASKGLFYAAVQAEPSINPGPTPARSSRIELGFAGHGDHRPGPAARKAGRRDDLEAAPVEDLADPDDLGGVLRGRIDPDLPAGRIQRLALDRPADRGRVVATGIVGRLGPQEGAEVGGLHRVGHHPVLAVFRLK